MRLPTSRPWRSGKATSTVSTAPLVMSSFNSAAVSIPGTVAIGEWYELLGRDVGGGDAAVDDERGAGHEGCVVGCEEERGLRQLPRAPEAAHRDVHHAPGPPLGIREQLLEQRGLDRSRAERVGADALARVLDRELA